MGDDLTLLTFLLDQIWYGIPVQDVHEVVPLPQLTPLPDAPSFVSGIFNLRGRIVTALDLRHRMGLKPRPYDVKNAVLVIRYKERFYGLIVDEALSLMTIPGQEMEDAPDLSSFVGSAQAKFVTGVGKLNQRLIPILNLRRIFSTVAEIQGVLQGQTQEPGETRPGRGVP